MNIIHTVVSFKIDSPLNHADDVVRESFVYRLSLFCPVEPFCNAVEKMRFFVIELTYWSEFAN